MSGRPRIRPHAGMERVKRERYRTLRCLGASSYYASVHCRSARLFEMARTHLGAPK